MKQLITVNQNVFQLDQAVIETTFEWWLEWHHFTEKSSGERKVRTLMYPCRLLRAMTGDGVLVTFPSDFKVNKDEWIVRVDKEGELKDVGMIFSEFYKLHQYAGDNEAKPDYSL